jgi:serine/threonine protein kinase
MVSLGKGTFGEVFKLTDKFSRRNMALKVLYKSEIDDENSFTKEILALSLAKSPMVVKIYGSAEAKDAYFIFMELCETNLKSMR